jgi:cell division protein FtsZ
MSNEITMEFDLPTNISSIIKVIGVGGGGSNAVNHMYKQGIVGVNFIVCNTDAQALEYSPVPNKIQLGPERTSGLGAGSNPEVGKLSCEESEEELKDILSKNTKMLFITAGMGGGTGTGAAPVVARIAREMGILTVGIVTTPFSYEGSRKINQAEEGIVAMKEYVDTILVISNDKLREMYASLKRSEAFAIANNILATAAKSISEIITVPGEMNVDFADVSHVMKNSGVAIMGIGLAEGEDRALRAVQSALNSPLLNDNDIKGAKKILINISSGTEEMSIDEMDTITDYIRESASSDVDVILGTVDDMNLGEKICVTLIATGFTTGNSAYIDKSNKVFTLSQESKDLAPAQLALEIPVPTLNEVVPTQDQYVLISNNEVVIAQENNEVVNEAPKNEVIDFMWDVPVENNESVMEVKKDDMLNFELKKPEETIESVAPVAPSNEITVIASSTSEPINFDANEQIRNERKNRLKDMSLKFNNSSSLQELENEPAYLRRNKQLEEVTPSNESSVSKYTVSNNVSFNGENRPEIKRNNPFLHDTVD